MLLYYSFLFGFILYSRNMCYGKNMYKKAEYLFTYSLNICHNNIH